MCYTHTDIYIYIYIYIIYIYINKYIYIYIYINVNIYSQKNLCQDQCQDQCANNIEPLRKAIKQFSSRLKAAVTKEGRSIKNVFD